MKKKLIKLGLWALILGAVILVIAYFLFHYMTPSGAMTTQFRAEPGKPWVTLLVSVFGVVHLAAGSVSLLAAGILFPGEKP